jgi:hypothetical protein
MPPVAIIHRLLLLSALLKKTLTKYLLLVAFLLKLSIIQLGVLITRETYSHEG